MVRSNYQKFWLSLDFNFYFALLPPLPLSTPLQNYISGPGILGGSCKAIAHGWSASFCPQAIPLPVLVGILGQGTFVKYFPTMKMVFSNGFPQIRAAWP